MNLELFTWLHAGAGTQPILDFFSVAAAEVTPYVVIACMAVFWFITNQVGKRILLEAAAVVGLGLLINQVITLFSFHPRPFMVDLCKPLIPHAPETSFPSDHATLLFSASLALLFRSGWKKEGILLCFPAIAGAWGRVYTGLHFPFDIIGSFFVALTSVAIMAFFRYKVLPIYDKIIYIEARVASFFSHKIVNR